MRWLLAVCAVVIAVSAARAQVQYARGQNVAPVFEGWERNPDGTFSMVFGYLNRNYQEELDIPVGSANSIEVAGQASGDHGQPTHFYPRRHASCFEWWCPRIGTSNRK